MFSGSHTGRSKSQPGAEAHSRDHGVQVSRIIGEARLSGSRQTLCPPCSGRALLAVSIVISGWGSGVSAFTK